MSWGQTPAVRYLGYFHSCDTIRVRLEMAAVGRRSCTLALNTPLPAIRFKSSATAGPRFIPSFSSINQESARRCSTGVGYVGYVKCEASTGSAVSTSGTEWVQRTVELPQFRRGCHIITQHIYRAVPEISQFRVGLAHIFVMHTSASLTINENASPDVPLDMEDTLNRMVPEGQIYRHLDEGLDDMPAHVKASMMGSSLTIPITAGKLHLGIWQGVWLNEHRDNGGSRTICITIQGEKRLDGRNYRASHYRDLDEGLDDLPGLHGCSFRIRQAFVSPQRATALIPKHQAI